MTEQLASLDDLPREYRNAMEAELITPLWPMMRDVLPHDSPKPGAKPACGHTSGSAPFCCAQAN
jgi:gentisate 1,2-dioxygenase